MVASVTRSRLPPIGFWSYVRRDDDISRGRVSELRELILGELEAQLGQEVPVFKDTVSIPHGSRWEDQTTHALSDATFFIPVLTPNFLQSEWCCREVQLFLARQRRLLEAYPDLPSVSRIFPIHYIDTTDADALDEEIRDALMGLQHLNFQGMRHRPSDDPAVQFELANFVTAIRNVLRLRVEVADGPLPGVEKTQRPRAAPAPRKPKPKPHKPRPRPPADHGLDVILTDHGLSKIMTTKEVQAIGGVTVREAMEIVDGLPWPVARGVSIEAAMEIMARIEAHGGTVELVARLTPAEEDTRPIAPPRPPPVPPPAGGGAGVAPPADAPPARGKAPVVIAGIAVAVLLLIVVLANQPQSYGGGATTNYAANVADSSEFATDNTTEVADYNGAATNEAANAVDDTIANAAENATYAPPPPPPPMRGVLVQNDCFREIKLRLSAFRNGTWDDGSAGHWTIAGNASRYLEENHVRIRTSNNGFYFQAESTDGQTVWNGEHSRTYDGRSYAMFYRTGTVNASGDFVVRLTCP